MKNFSKKFLICSVAAFFCIIAITGLILGVIKIHNNKALQNKIIVGFYDISKENEKVFTNIIQEICGQKEFEVIFHTLNEDEDFSKQINDKKINLIFSPAGFAVQKAINETAGDNTVPLEVLDGLFSSMRSSVITKDNKIKAFPLVFDNLEIDIETSAFSMSGMKSLATWDDIEKFAENQKGYILAPISLAGAENVFLLDLMGAMGEALEGYEAYNTAAKILQNAAEEKKSGQDFNAVLTAKKLFIDPEAPLPYSLYYIKELVKKGYITQASRELVHKDINSYIEERVTSGFFTSLSVHRTYNTKAVSRFSSIYFPSKQKTEQRYFTANITYAVPLTKNQKVAGLIEELLSNSIQEKLSQQTGLAPVLANCRTPDQQANDARFWIAATNAPLAGLGHEAELSKEDLAKLADEIRALVFF